MDTDVDMLIPGPQVVDNRQKFEESEEDLSRTFFKIGLAQLILGFLVLVGGILVTAMTWRSVDTAGEGIWCGVLVMVCGSLAITSRYHLLSGVVIASLTLNVVTSLALLGGIILGVISTADNLVDFSYYYYGSGGTYGAFLGLNCGLIACIILSIYMAIVSAKMLNQKTNFKNDCCQRTPNDGVYSMVYVPPGMQQQPGAPRQVGAFMAAPFAQAAQMQQT